MSALEEALTANRDASKRLLAHARSVPTKQWAQPVAPGKWSPAQIVDHVAISNDVAVKAIQGDRSMGSIPRVLRVIPRVLGFNPTIRRGKFPARQRGPAVFAPSAEALGYETVAAHLERAVERLAATTRELAQQGTAHFEHPFFGRVSIADYVRFTALHAEHHEGQLPG